MFKLQQPYIHYGAERYPLNGLLEMGVPQTVECVEDINIETLIDAVGHCSGGFPPEGFDIRLVDMKQRLLDLGHTEAEVSAFPLRRNIVAQADGYSIVWVESD